MQEESPRATMAPLKGNTTLHLVCMTFHMILHHVELGCSKRTPFKRQCVGWKFKLSTSWCLSIVPRRVWIRPIIGVVCHIILRYSISRTSSRATRLLSSGMFFCQSPEYVLIGSHSRPSKPTKVDRVHIHNKDTSHNRPPRRSMCEFSHCDEVLLYSPAA